MGCVLVAAGSGVRLGHGRPKALVEVGGRSLLEHAVAGLAACRWTPPGEASRPVVDDLAVVVPVDDLEHCRPLVAAAWTGAGGTGEPAVVSGGAHRQASVARGLAVLPADVDVVLVHDAARAFAPPSLLARVVVAVQGDVVAVVPGLAVTDTIKRLAPRRPGAGTRAVEQTLPREDLVAVQTPQGFRADVLRAVHAAADAGPPPPGSVVGTGGAGDDAGMVEAAGHTVVVVDGDADAFKVTGPADLVLAEALLARRAGPT